MNMKRLKNTLLYIVQTPVALLAAIVFSTWLWLPDWVKKIWYRFWMCAIAEPPEGGTESG